MAVPGGCNIGSRQIDLHLKGFEDMGNDYSIEYGYVNCQVNGSIGIEEKKQKKLADPDATNSNHFRNTGSYQYNTCYAVPFI